MDATNESGLFHSRHWPDAIRRLVLVSSSEAAQAETIHEHQVPDSLQLAVNKTFGPKELVACFSGLDGCAHATSLQSGNRNECRELIRIEGAIPSIWRMYETMARRPMTSHNSFRWIYHASVIQPNPGSVCSHPANGAEGRRQL